MAVILAFFKKIGPCIGGTTVVLDGDDGGATAVRDRRCPLRAVI